MIALYPSRDERSFPSRRQPSPEATAAMDAAQWLQLRGGHRKSAKRMIAPQFPETLINSRANAHATQFLSLAGKGLGLAALSSATVASLLKNVEAATKTVAHLTPEQAAMDEDYWAVIQNSFTRHAWHHQSEQRRRFAQPADRDRGAGALHLATGRRHRLHDVANSRAAIGNDPHRPGGIVRLRSRRDCDHPQRFRVARDSFDGHGLQVRRRNSHHHPGLSAHADHAAPAGEAGRPEAQADPDSHSAQEPQ